MTAQITPDTLFKILGSGGEPCNGGSGKWNLPKGKRPGKWMPKIDGIIPCLRGYHLCRPQDLPKWSGDTLYIAEQRGLFVVHDDSKIVAEQARLIAQVPNYIGIMTQWTVDCAERCLVNFEKTFPDDNRVRDCIMMTRQFLQGEATKEELELAESAAWSAAESAWSAWSTAESAAWSAAESAAESAAWSAWSAARSAAKSAGSAARSAAESAAKSAGSAARSARSAEHDWQWKRLFELICAGEAS